MANYFCPDCGNQLAMTDQFCNNCGQPRKGDSKNFVKPTKFERKAFVSKPLGFLLQLGSCILAFVALATFKQDPGTAITMLLVAVALVYIGSRTKNREKS